jgi:hypothetical protein
MAITAAVAAAVVAAPIAQTTEHGTLLTRAGRAATAATDAPAYPRLASGKGFSFSAPTGWRTVRAPLIYPRLVSGQGFSFPAPVGWPTLAPSPGAVAIRPDRFDWADAGIGAGVTAAMGLLAAAGVLLVRRRLIVAQPNV